MSESKPPLEACFGGHAWLSRLSLVTRRPDGVLAFPARCGVCASTKTVLVYPPDGHKHSLAVQKSPGFAALCAAIPAHERRRYFYEYLSRRVTRDG